jgi:hypothetical protein
MPRALKPLFTMALRQSDDTLRLSTVGLFCAFFPAGSVPSHLDESCSRQARAQQLPESSADLRHSGTYAQPPHLTRRGDHSRSIRSIRSMSLAQPPRRGPTPRSGGEGGHTSRRDSRNRIAKNKATLPLIKHAPYPHTSCVFVAFHELKATSVQEDPRPNTGHAISRSNRMGATTAPRWR